MRNNYYVKGYPWSSGIGTNVEDCVTSKDVMEKARLNFSVDKCELVAKMPFSLNNPIIANEDDAFSYGGRIYRDCPNAYATYRTDTCIPLGLVKSKYQVVQNTDAFSFFDDAIGPGKAKWQTAGMFGYGHKVFISAKLPITTTIKGDPVENYLVFSNSHDGSSSINIMFTPIRVFCTNCLAAAFNSASAYIRIRHTKTAKEKLQTGAEVLKIACAYADHAQQLYECLYEIKLGDDVVMKYLADLVLSDDEIGRLNAYDPDKGYKKLMYRDYRTLEESEISTRKANQIATMFDYYQNGVAQDKIVGTAWGAYNAVTGYFSNVANLNGEKRMDSLLYGNGSNVMSNALEEIVQLAEAV